MGIRLEFLIGDPNEIADIVRDVDYDRLDEATKRSADLSLHITPHDLDLLSHEFGVASAQLPRDLRSHLSLFVDELDRGVFEVEKTWVDYVASVPEPAIAFIVENWAEKMREEYGDPEILATDEMKVGVADLITLCAAAKNGADRVVHLWLA